MNLGLYQAASALNANSRWQESIAQNLAASSIPGFKKQELSFGAIEAGLKPSVVPGAENRHFALPQASSATNFSAGELKFTGGKTALALDGKGFFAAEMAHLITAMRMYEASQRVIQAQDERMGRAIAELGGY